MSVFAYSSCRYIYEIIFIITILHRHSFGGGVGGVVAQLLIQCWRNLHNTKNNFIFLYRSKRNSQNIDTWKFANPMDAFKVCRNTRNNPTGACKCCSITVCILKVSCLNQMCLLLLLSALTIYLFLNLVYLIV